MVIPAPNYPVPGVLLVSRNESTQVNDGNWIKILDLEDGASAMQGLSITWKSILAVVLFLSLIFGCVNKKIILNHLKKTKLLDRPINILILVDQVLTQDN